MDVRRLLPIVVVPLLVAALPADAAPKKSKPNCGGAFTDPRGDAGVFSNSSLDLTGGDLALGSREFVAVLRVAGTQTGAPAAVPAEWEYGVSGNGVRYEFTRRVSTAGVQTSSVHVGGQSVPHKLTVVGGTLVWRFARKSAPALAKPRIVWHDAAAQTSVAGVPVDNASAARCSS